MELRGQEKDSMPNSMSYNPSSLNHESSAKVASVPAVSTLPERRGNEPRLPGPNQTLDQPNLIQHQHQHHRQPHLLQPDLHDKDLNPDPDPAQVANATATNASNSKIPPPPPPQAAASATSSITSVRYRECQKNHAASMGGQVVDGCGEFMPSGEDGTPEALRCAACNCHRNFHRKDSDGDPQTGTSGYYAQAHTRNNTTALHSSVFRTQPQLSLLTMPPQQQYHKYSHSYSHGFTTSPTAPIMMTFGVSGGAPAESSSEDLNMFQCEAGAQGIAHQSFSASKKRFRTKFTQQQKERMQEFAEKLGWKIQKQDEQEVQQFCNEVGVKRQVFKVWMHNNKAAMKKKQL